MKKRLFSFRLSQRTRAIINIFLILVLVLLNYLSAGCPPLSVMHQFRRAEKTSLLGPAKVLDRISLKEYSGYGHYDGLIIATGDEGVTLFHYSKQNLQNYYDLVYREKQVDMTVLAVPGLIQSDLDYIEVPVLVLDNFPDAVRAEMVINLSLPDSQTYETIYEKEYTLTATRAHKGYFLFEITATRSSKADKEFEAIEVLTRYCNSETLPDAYDQRPFPVTVRFYDRNDNLITQRTLQIRTLAGEARANS